MDRTVYILLTIGIRSRRQPGISPEGQFRGSASARLGQVQGGSRRMRPPKFLPTGHGGGADARPRFHPARPVFDTRCRRGGGACRSSLRRAQLTTATGRPAMTRPRGIDRAIRLSTAAAVLAVAGIAAYVSYGHAYAVVRAHGETGITARLEPATIDGLVYASSMLVVLYAARHRVPVPSLARWLLALGIAATLTANMAQGWSHGPLGAVVAAWPAVSLVGSYELLVWLIRACGAADRVLPAGHCARVRPAVLRYVLSRPQPLPASAPQGTSATRQTRCGGPRVRPPGSRLSPPADSVTMRRLGPALAMTRRWPRTGSACRPAIRCRNAGSPRCSGAHPAAGREPGSPMHGRHRRSQTRRAPRSRLTGKQRPPAVSPGAIVTAPGRSGIWAWRSARCAFWVNLDPIRVKVRSGWASPPGPTRPRSGSSARPWVLRWPSMLGTPWNWRPGTATGSSHSAPAAAPSSSTAATATAPSPARDGRPGSGERRVCPRRRQAARQARIRRHPDLAHLPGTRRDIHSLSARMSGRTRSICGISTRSGRQHSHGHLMTATYRYQVG